MDKRCGGGERGLVSPLLADRRRHRIEVGDRAGLDFQVALAGVIARPRSVSRLAWPQQFPMPAADNLFRQ